MGTEVEHPDQMGRRRALLTDAERRRIGDDPDDEEEQNYRYQAISRVRNKIEDELPEDVAILGESHPELLEELRDVVCPDDATAEYTRDDYEALLEERDELQDEVERQQTIDADRLGKSVAAALRYLDGQDPDVEAAQSELESVQEVLNDA